MESNSWKYETSSHFHIKTITECFPKWGFHFYSPKPIIWCYISSVLVSVHLVTKIQIPPRQKSNRDFSVRFSGSHIAVAEGLNLGISSIHAIPSAKCYQTEAAFILFTPPLPSPSLVTIVCVAVWENIPPFT